MISVRDIAEDIVNREGGFVNDPDDPGGATNFGVTIHTMRRLGVDVTGDGVVDVRDVRALSRSQAVDIFIKHYFEQPCIGELPAGLQASVFDMYVNAGSNAVRILQQLLRDIGLNVTVDGVLGPQSIKAAVQAMRAAPDHLVDAYGIARRNYYFRLADKRTASRKYARTRAGGKGGWIRRAEEFIAPVYHLSPAEFQKKGGIMGLMERVLTLVFGGQTNVVRDTVEVFRENAEAGAQRSADVQGQAMTQFGTEFMIERRGGFDRFMDGLNRLPRPALALGTLGLFISAMVAPLWFSERMQGIALVPEPLWWLLGVIVSFYFGARHQVKAQEFQREIADTITRVPQVLNNIAEIRKMGGDSIAVADTGPDAALAASVVKSEGNAALEAWRRSRT